jgi:hypothetical protein
VLTQRALEIVAAHEPEESLYLYLAFHNVHEPQQAPVSPNAESLPMRSLGSGSERSLGHSSPRCSGTSGSPGTCGRSKTRSRPRWIMVWAMSRRHWRSTGSTSARS